MQPCPTETHCNAFATNTSTMFFRGKAFPFSSEKNVCSLLHGNPPQDRGIYWLCRNVTRRTAHTKKTAKSQHSWNRLQSGKWFVVPGIREVIPIRYPRNRSELPRPTSPPGEDKLLMGSTMSCATAARPGGCEFSRYLSYSREIHWIINHVTISR